MATAREVIRLAALRLGVTLPPTVETNATVTARDVIVAAVRDLGVEGLPAGPGNSTQTARQVITQALTDLGAIAAAETPSAEDADEALKSLQIMLDAWANEGVTFGLATLTLDTELFVPSRYIEAIRANLAVRLSASYGMTPQPALTERATGLYGLLRAVARTDAQLQILQQMLDAWALDGIDYGLGTLNLASVIAVPARHVQAIRQNLAVLIARRVGLPPDPAIAEQAQVQYAYVRQYARAAEGLPILQEMLAGLDLHGIATGATVASLTSEIYLPDNHLAALRALLAVDLAPIFGVNVPPAVASQAEMGRRLLQAAYTRPPMLRMDRMYGAYGYSVPVGTSAPSSPTVYVPADFLELEEGGALTTEALEYIEV